MKNGWWKLRALLILIGGSYLFGSLVCESFDMKNWTDAMLSSIIMLWTFSLVLYGVEVLNIKR